MKFLAFALLYLSSSIFAGDNDRFYTNSFLDIPLGARAAGMGNAYGAIADDGTAFYWNPAGIVLGHKREISMTFADHYGGFGQYSFIGYTHQLKDNYAFSVSWIRYSIGSIKEFKELADNFNDRVNPDYDFSKYYNGRFDYADNALFFSFAKLNKFRLNLGWLYNEFPIQIPIGVNFKVITGGTNGIKGDPTPINPNNVIQTDAKKFGIGVDVGTMIMFGMNDFLETPYLGDFALGLNIQDATTTAVRWNALSSTTRAQDVAPINVKFAISYIQPLDELQSNVLLTYERNSRYEANYHYGVEYDYKKTVALRLGYDDGLITYGTGVSMYNFHLDYALLNHDLGNVHRISVSYKF